MKAISIWASRNTQKAILLIVLIELVKGIIGFEIGQNFLPEFSTTFIELSVLCLIFLISFVQINYQSKHWELSQNLRRRLRIKSTGILFLSSLFLSVLLGNHFKNLGYSVNGLLVANAAVSIPADSVQQTISTETIGKKHLLKQKKRFFSKKTAEDDPHSNRRIGYVLLFLLSLVLTYFGAYLSCSLLCGGYGIIAFLTALLTLGVLSGGIYFLIKAFSKTVRPFADMTKEEKKKERKKFFIILAGVTAFVVLYFILGVS